MYQIIIKKKAKKFIDKLPINERKRIVYAIEHLPNGEDIKKLKGQQKILINGMPCISRIQNFYSKKSSPRFPRKLLSPTLSVPIPFSVLHPFFLPIFRHIRLQHNLPHRQNPPR